MHLFVFFTDVTAVLIMATFFGDTALCMGCCSSGIGLSALHFGMQYSIVSSIENRLLGNCSIQKCHTVLTIHRLLYTAALEKVVWYTMLFAWSL